MLENCKGERAKKVQEDRPLKGMEWYPNAKALELLHKQGGRTHYYNRANKDRENIELGKKEWKGFEAGH